MAHKYTPMNLQDAAPQQWRLIDCTDKTLGRLATEIAQILRGKDRPTFTPHQDTGDFVVAINAAKVKFTGKNKWDDKHYYRHSGFPGGIRSTTAREMRDRHPEDIIRKAVRGMLPKNTLAVALLKKLKISADANHQYRAQLPTA